jgi:hypothetical protein
VRRRAGARTAWRPPRRTKAAESVSRVCEADFGKNLRFSVPPCLTVPSVRSVVSALDDEPALRKKFAKPLAEIPLQLDRAVEDDATGSACALELETKLFQERRVVREPVDHADRFSASPLLLDPQLRHNPGGDCLVGGCALAASAVRRRPAAARAHSSRVGGIDNACVPASGHGPIMREKRSVPQGEGYSSTTEGNRYERGSTANNINEYRDLGSHRELRGSAKPSALRD